MAGVEYVECVGSGVWFERPSAADEQVENKGNDDFQAAAGQFPLWMEKTTNSLILNEKLKFARLFSGSMSEKGCDPHVICWYIRLLTLYIEQVYGNRHPEGYFGPRGAVRQSD